MNRLSVPTELPEMPDLSGLPSETRDALSALVRSAMTYRGAFFATLQGKRPMTVVRKYEPTLHLSDQVLNAWATHLEISL